MEKKCRQVTTCISYLLIPKRYILQHTRGKLLHILCKFHCHAFRILLHRQDRHQHIVELIEHPLCCYFCIRLHIFGMLRRKPCKVFRIVPFLVFLCILLRRHHIQLHMPNRHQCNLVILGYSFYMKFRISSETLLPVLQFRCCPVFYF